MLIVEMWRFGNGYLGGSGGRGDGADIGPPARRRREILEPRAARGLMPIALGMGILLSWLCTVGTGCGGETAQGVQRRGAGSERGAAAGARSEKVGRTADSVRVAFGADCEALVIGAIDGATREILVAMYSFTRRGIAKALGRAVGRGVAVQVKYDFKSSDWPGMKQTIGFLKNRGVTCTPVRMAGEYAKMHHKFTVVDQELVLTGSFNYSASAAMHSYENVVRIDSLTVAAAFAAEFSKIADRE